MHTCMHIHCSYYMNPNLSSFSKNCSTSSVPSLLSFTSSSSQQKIYAGTTFPSEFLFQISSCPSKNFTNTFVISCLKLGQSQILPFDTNARTIQTCSLRNLAMLGFVSVREFLRRLSTSNSTFSSASFFSSSWRFFSLRSRRFSAFLLSLMYDTYFARSKDGCQPMMTSPPSM